jgi:hypothetical protein
VTIGFALPFSPLAHTLGFTRLPHDLAIIPTYLLVLEAGKRLFYRRPAATPRRRSRGKPHEHRTLRRAGASTARDALDGTGRRPFMLLALGGVARDFPGVPLKPIPVHSTLRTRPTGGFLANR